MRVAAVFFPAKDRKKILDITKGLAKGIESQGHTVDIIDGTRDVNTKLTIYKYIVVGAEKVTFTGIGKTTIASKSFFLLKKNVPRSIDKNRRRWNSYRHSIQLCDVRRSCSYQQEP